MAQVHIPVIRSFYFFIFFFGGRRGIWVSSSSTACGGPQLFLVFWFFSFVEIRKKNYNPPPKAIGKRLLAQRPTVKRIFSIEEPSGCATRGTSGIRLFSLFFRFFFSFFSALFSSGSAALCCFASLRCRYISQRLRMEARGLSTTRARQAFSFLDVFWRGQKKNFKIPFRLFWLLSRTIHTPFCFEPPFLFGFFLVFFFKKKPFPLEIADNQTESNRKAFLAQ